MRKRKISYRINHRSVERRESEEIVENGYTPMIASEEKRSDSRLHIKGHGDDNDVTRFH